MVKFYDEIILDKTLKTQQQHNKNANLKIFYGLGN